MMQRPTPKSTSKAQERARWILFLPIGYIAALVTVSIVDALLSLAKLNHTFLWTSAFSLSLSVVTWIFVSAKVAPKQHALVALIMGLVPVILMLVATVLFLLTSDFSVANPFANNPLTAPMLAIALPALLPYLILRRR